MQILKLYTGPLTLIVMALFFLFFPLILAFIVSSLMILGALLWIKLIFNFSKINKNYQQHSSPSQTGQTYDYDTGTFVQEEPNFKNVTFIIKKKFDRFY